MVLVAAPLVTVAAAALAAALELARCTPARVSTAGQAALAERATAFAEQAKAFREAAALS